MAFSEVQTKALSAKLQAKHVRLRDGDGVALPYIEGWHAIAEANRIFGFEGWDRETIETRCVWHGTHRGRPACAYMARVRVRVRAGDEIVLREGSGTGHGQGSSPGEAHERALKTAETDATKRALVTFGNSFGLALYDPKQTGVRGRSPDRELRRPVRWSLFPSRAEGGAPEIFDDPAAFCRALHIAMAAAPTVDDLDTLYRRHGQTLGRLRRELPTLTHSDGQHHVDVIEALRVERHRLLRERSSEPSRQVSSNANFDERVAPAIDHPRRVRDRTHLAYVSTQACSVCGRNPAQAHHLTFVQPKAMGRKAGDQWAVPLCAVHHRELHDAGDEQAWWRGHRVDAKGLALSLWQLHRHGHQSEGHMPAA